MTKLNIKKYQWNPIRYTLHTVPWGYEKDPEDPQLLLPIPEYLDALEQAKDFREQGRSLREISRWLTSYTGIKLTHSGLVKRIERDNEQFEEQNSE